MFGSTGGTGRLILAGASRRGHEVTAFARRPGALAGVPGLAAVVEGDGRDQDLAAKAVSGQEAVIMTVSGRGQPGVVAAVARAVTAAMAGAGLQREAVDRAGELGRLFSPGGFVAARNRPPCWCRIALSR